MDPQAIVLSSASVARYFSGADVSLSTSNYMSMCEQSVTIAHASVECRVCDGMGFRSVDPEELKKWMRRLATEVDPDKRKQMRETISRESTCPVCIGSGYTTMRRIDMAHAMHAMFTTVRCSKCRGCGETFPPNDQTAEVQDVCPGCHGLMYIVPVSVKEKGSTKSGKPPKRESGAAEEFEDAVHACSDWVDEDALVERGRISRELDELRKTNPEISAALASYYGMDGDKWAGHKWGRKFALWQHTPAGVQIARDGAEQSRTGHRLRLNPLDLIANERDADNRAGSEGRATREARHRAALIGQADKQARELLTRMRSAIQFTEAA